MGTTLEDLCSLASNPDEEESMWEIWAPDVDKEEREKVSKEACSLEDDIQGLKNDMAVKAYENGTCIRKNATVLVDADRLFREQIQDLRGPFPESMDVDWGGSFFNYGTPGDPHRGTRSPFSRGWFESTEDEDELWHKGGWESKRSLYGVKATDPLEEGKGLFDDYSGDSASLRGVKTDANFVLAAFYHQIKLIHSQEALTEESLGELRSGGGTGPGALYPLIGMKDSMDDPGVLMMTEIDRPVAGNFHPYKYMFSLGMEPLTLAETLPRPGNVDAYETQIEDMYRPYYDTLFAGTDGAYVATLGVSSDGATHLAEKMSWMGKTVNSYNDLDDSDAAPKLMSAQFTLGHLPDRMNEVAARLEEKGLSHYARVFKILAQNISDPAVKILECIEELGDATVPLRKRIDRFEDKMDEALEGAYDAINDLDLIGAIGDINEYVDDNYGGIEGIVDIEFKKDPKKVFFKEQCLLLSYLDHFVAYRKSKNQAAHIRDLGHGVMENENAAATADLVAGGTPEEEAKTLSAAPQPSQHADLSLLKRLPYVAGNADGWYGNACCEVDGDPYGFVNTLTMDKQQSAYINIDNNKLSYLQPKIRLYKVITDDEGAEHDLEFKFDTHFSENDMMVFKSRNQRSSGVGLKSFEFTYDGSNPFSAKKSIKATLKIFASTFDELLQCRGGPCTHLQSAAKDSEGKIAYHAGDPVGYDELGSPYNSYKYVDLALKTFSGKKSKSDECENMSQQAKIEQENDTLAKLNFRLKATVGVSLPQNSAFQDMTTRELNELGRGLNSNTVTLNLTPTIHNFDFDEQGRVVFTINYLAFVDDFYDDKAFNIFAHAPVSKVRMAREIRFKAAEQACEGDKLDEIKKENARNAAQEFKILFSSIIDKMVQRDKIRYLSLETEDIIHFASGGPYASSLQEFPAEKLKILSGKGYNETLTDNVGEALNAWDDAQDEDADESIRENPSAAISAALLVESPKKQNLSFFYVSDLIDIILQNIEEELMALPELLEGEVDPEQPLRGHKAGSSADMSDCLKMQTARQYKKYHRAFKKLRIVMGPVEITPNVKGSEKTAFVNFGDIPVSVKYFVEWMTMRFFNKSDYVYSLSKFCMDLMNNLIDQFLNSDKCFGYGVRQKVRLNQAVISGHGESVGTGGELVDYAQGFELQPGEVRDSFTQECLNQDAVRFDLQSLPKSRRPLLRTSGYVAGSPRSSIPVAEEVNYFIFFAGQTVPTELMNGDKNEDEDRGIFHYMIGRDKGLVKKIDLSKASTPGLAEVRFEQEGYDGLRQLRVVYDATIHSYINVNTFPGTYLYIEPRGFSPSAVEYDLTQFGLGGYYMIIRTRHMFKPGTAESKIECKWVNQIDALAQNASMERTAAEAKSTYACGAAETAIADGVVINDGRRDARDDRVASVMPSGFQQ